MQSNNQYRLYIGRYTRIPHETYSYFNPQSGYLLLFTNQDPGDGFRMVPPANESRLTQEERRWLRMSKMEVNRVAMEENREDYQTVISAFLDAFERECEIEKKKLKGGEPKKNAEQQEAGNTGQREPGADTSQSG